jgi:hypothetical protein
MWKHDNYYQVSAKERQFYDEKLREVYDQFNMNFDIMGEDPRFPDYTAYLEHDQVTNNISLVCGRFWHETSNICPVLAMTHELGHYIDVTQNFGGNFEEYNRNLGTLEMETRAWEYAYHVCNAMEYTDWDVFYQYAETCLNTYFNAWRLPLDRRYQFRGNPPTKTDSLNRIRSLIGMEPLVEGNFNSIESLLRKWETGRTKRKEEQSAAQKLLNKKKENIEHKKALKEVVMKAKRWEL